MRKKTQKEPSELTAPVAAQVEPTLLTMDFGREDLNLMRDVVNDLIRRK